MNNEVLLRLRLQGQRAVQSGLADTAQSQLKMRDAAIKVERAEKQAGAAVKKFGIFSLEAREAQLKLEQAQAKVAAGQSKVSAQTERSSRAMHGLKRAVGAAGAAFAGVSVLSFLKESAKDAARSEVSQAKMAAQLKSTGISYKDHAKQIDKVIQSTSKLAALDDEDLQDAFTNIVRTTGSVSKSLKLTGLAADLARAKHMDVAKAGEIVAKVAGGNIGILSRYGITIDKNASSSDALAALQKRVAGQAEAYGKTSAGANDRLRVSMENLREKIGKALTPTLAALAGQMTTFIDGMQNGTGWGGKFAAVVTTIAKVVKGAVTIIASLVKGFKDGNAPAVALGVAVGSLTAAIVAYKVAMKVARTAQIALNVTMAANPAVLLAAAVIAVGVAFYIAYRKVKPFRNAVDGTFRFIKDHWPLLFGIITGPIGLAAGAVIDSFGKIKAGFKSVASTAKTVFGSLGRGLAALLKAPVNAVIGLLNNLHIKIPKINAGPLHIGGGEIGFNIQPLAKGGTVKSPVQLVGEHGPELAAMPLGSRVFNARQTAQALQANGGGGMDALLHEIRGLARAIMAHDTVLKVHGRELARVNVAQLHREDTIAGLT